MAGMGPTPKADGAKRRRNAPMANTIQLPSAGRQGPAPAWPLTTYCPEKIWADLWATPQAVAWERIGAVRMVARYAMVLQEGEATVSLAHAAEARQLEDRLGLSPMAMLRLHWEISTDELAEMREDKADRPTKPRPVLNIAS